MCAGDKESSGFSNSGKIPVISLPNQAEGESGDWLFLGLSLVLQSKSGVRHTKSYTLSLQSLPVQTPPSPQFSKTQTPVNKHITSVTVAAAFGFLIVLQ